MLLNNRYAVLDQIDRTATATVCRGRDIISDRVVAIKLLREEYSTDPKFMALFQREARLMSTLQHPNIVRVLDAGQTDSVYFIVMELAECTNLLRYMRSRPYGMLGIDRAMRIAHDVAVGLGAAHQRSIIHRDVQPRNILICRDGTIKLTNFIPITVGSSAEECAMTGATLGSVQYYAPERALGEAVGTESDVYALGCVMYELLTGHAPFDGDTPVAVAMQHIQDVPVAPSTVNPQVGAALDAVVLRCLEKIPARRYRDGGELAAALEGLA